MNTIRYNICCHKRIMLYLNTIWFIQDINLFSAGLALTWRIFDILWYLPSLATRHAGMQVYSLSFYNVIMNTIRYNICFHKRIMLHLNTKWFIQDINIFSAGLALSRRIFDILLYLPSLATRPSLSYRGPCH
jgi:hypothetical protein